MSDNPTVVILGVTDPCEVPGADALRGTAELRCADSAASLQDHLPGAQILLGWDFHGSEVERAWQAATDLRWIHWGFAGVDKLLFPALVASEVTVTNSRGIFDRAMAEYVLGLMIAMAKDFPRTLAAQAERRWSFRLEECIHGKSALIVGVGSIGSEIARLLLAAGLQVKGVGRRARSGHPDFGHVHAQDELNDLLGEADYVINVVPKTAETDGMYAAKQFARMKPSARFINVGRGSSVDEIALLDALENGRIKGAALDVFKHEPLPADSPLWSAPNLIVSPHMSGDYHESRAATARQFLDNFRRFRAGKRLINVVDKSLGYVPA